MAKMRNSESHHIAKILDVRIALEGANQSADLLQLDSNSSAKKPQEDEEMKEVGENEEGEAGLSTHSTFPISKINKGKKQHKFEYYITYLGHQRRNDRWILEEELYYNEQEI